jgi:hypothetical protein
MGPEQALKILFRDSNTNADDIMLKKKGKKKEKKAIIDSQHKK